MRCLPSLVAALVLVVGGADAARAGILYGSDLSSNQLLTINTSSGVAAALGPLGFGFVRGLAFDPNTDTLYGAELGPTQRLLTINTSTGVASVVGAFGFSVQGLAFDPNTNTLYGVDSVFNPDRLVTINTSTGAASLVGAIGFTNVHGLAFDPNTNVLYGSDATTDELLTIDTSPRVRARQSVRLGLIRSLA